MHGQQEVGLVSMVRSVMRVVLPAAAGLVMVMAAPAQAQFSDGYKFLEAVKKKDLEKVNELLEGPGSVLVNTRDITTEETALHIATKRRDIGWMALLVQRGAQVNVRDREGVTPLVLASNLGFIEGVQFLVEKQARVDDANDAGETPLISAVHRRNLDLLRILLRAGANPDRKDNSGRSARDYARDDRNGAQMLAEIEALAKVKPAAPAQRPVYGPSL